MRTRHAQNGRHAGVTLAATVLGVALGATGPWAPASRAQAPAGEVAVELRPYEPVAGISGSLTAVGSDTLANVMTLWAEAYAARYPGVRMQVEGKGSSTAPAALIAGTAQLGPMSRAMKPSEIAAFESRFGYPPTPIRVAIDALAVYVHEDNPLASLDLEQVDAVFSKTRRCGGLLPIDTWGALGVGGAFATRPIRLYGRNSASGTYGHFKEVALCRGDLQDTVQELPGSASVVQAVREDRFGIAYGGIGYATSGVRALPLAEHRGAAPGSPLAEDVYAGRYPLARPLLVYVNRPPGAALDPLSREFLRFALSRDGQETVRRGGFLPLPPLSAARELAKLG